MSLFNLKTILRTLFGNSSNGKGAEDNNKIEAPKTKTRTPRNHNGLRDGLIIGVRRL